MFGVGSYSIIVGTITSVLSSMDERSEVINSKIRYVELYAKDTKLNPEFTKKLIKTIKAHAEKGSIEDSSVNVIINSLPKKLKYELCMNIYNKAA